MSGDRVGRHSPEDGPVPTSPARPAGPDPRMLAGPGLLVGAGRFASELGMLAALGVGGWTLGAPAGAVLGVLLAAAVPVLAAVVWGRWVAPRASRRLEDPARLGVEVVLFGGAAGGLALSGRVGWAVALGLLWAVTAPFGRRSTAD